MLSENDIKILEFVHTNGCVAINMGQYYEIDLAADSRLQNLSELGYIKPHEANSDINYPGIYEVTPKGYAFLSDYHRNIQLSREAYQRNIKLSIYIPLAVTIISNLLIMLLKFALSQL